MRIALDFLHRHPLELDHLPLSAIAEIEAFRQVREGE